MPGADPGPTPYRPPQSGLERGIGRWSLVAFAINTTIGGGIFGLPSAVFARTGAYSLLAFVLCAILAGLILLCFAEVSSRFERTGGVYLYAREAFGPVAGFEIGWLVWLQRVTGFAVLANLSVSYLGFLWPAAGGLAGRIAIISALCVSLTIANIRGVRRAALLSNFFTVSKLVPLTLFIVVGLFFLDGDRFVLGPPPPAQAITASVLLLVFAFIGFDTAVIPAGEVIEPRRNFPFAMLVAQAVVTTVYVLVQVVCIGTLPGLAESERPLADAGSRFLGTTGASIIVAGAVISMVGTLLTTVLSAPRVLFALAEQGQLPAALARTHERYRTPHVAILVSSAVMLAVALSGTFIYAVTINAMIRLITHIVTCGALLAFRRRRDVPPAVFPLPAGGLIATVTLAFAAWVLLSQSTAREARDLAIAAAVGLVVYMIYRQWSRRTNLERDAVPAVARKED